MGELEGVKRKHFNLDQPHLQGKCVHGAAHMAKAEGATIWLLWHSSRILVRNV